MTHDAHQKVKASHLKRSAYLYVRQSTLRQVLENTESTQRQYALRQQAVALGWPLDRVIVIDTDLGQSGASAADREGFQRLVTEVSLARAGIVLGLEVSRLARNSMDWHRLLEICALTDTLILDEDGVYDPAHFNDRLLLGLKGTMSEAELHVLRARLQGGIRNKARRGELFVRPAMGFVYNADGKLVIDPDQQVQQSVRVLFETFRRTGSAMATVKFFTAQGRSSRAVFIRGPTKATPCGPDWNIAVFCASSTTRDIRVPSFMGELILARRWTVTASSNVCRKRNGKCSSGRSTPAISTGTSMNGISATSETTAKPMALTGARVHREKDPRCCKGCCFAGAAASG